MAIRSDAQRRAVAKYNAKNYETIQFRVKKGERAQIQSHALGTGESVNAFIRRAVENQIARDVAERSPDPIG